MYEYNNYPYENPYQRYSSAPQNPAPQEPEGKPPKKSGNKRMFAAILCACLVTSSAAGFGGGYLAGLTNNTSQPAAAEVQGTAPAAPASVTPAAGGNGAMTVSQVVSSVSDTVVEIGTEVQTTNFFMQPVTGQAAGSGVIISSDGYIVTNNHVIDGAKSINVRLKNGDSYPATLVGTDPQTDLAVVKIEATGLQAASMGTSSSLQVGDDAIAIGNPLGELGGTVTNGIISATSREITVQGENMTLLQTNAAINPGNSGGGLFNNRGELIGIVDAKYSGNGVEGLGFAIPIDTAKTVINDLISHGYVTGRGELGISVMNIADERTAFMYRVPQTGVYVAGVTEGSAAQQAGLKVGDGIVAVGGQEVASSDELKKQLEAYSAGDTVELTILRDSRKQTVHVTLGESVPESVKQQEAFAA